jgi:hypothetical protein
LQTESNEWLVDNLPRSTARDVSTQHRVVSCLKADTNVVQSPLFELIVLLFEANFAIEQGVADLNMILVNT